MSAFRAISDAFGYPIASIHWKPAVNDFSSLEEFTRAAFGKGLQSRQYRMAREGTMEEWIQNFTSAAHHLGTARMASASTHGVVNSQLQVFGVKNLYLCDGSVFSTAEAPIRRLRLPRLVSVLPITCSGYRRDLEAGNKLRNAESSTDRWIGDRRRKNACNPGIPLRQALLRSKLCWRNTERCYIV